MSKSKKTTKKTLNKKTSTKKQSKNIIDSKNSEKGEKPDIMDPLFKKHIDNMMEDMLEYITKLYDAATQDTKTNTYTYKFFKSAMEIELKKAKRGIQEMCILIIDIDFFKKINDTYGHFKGDEILIRLAEILKETTREYDIVSRFGGEEFIILFEGLSLEEAKKTSIRIREKIKKDSFLKKYKVNISGGLATYNKNDTVNKILEKSDKALYNAKESGRNRLVFAKSDKSFEKFS